MKRRTKVAILATSLLVGIALIGVGFASWIVSHESEASVAGNIKTETVTDKSNEIKAEVTSEKDIVFGSDKGSYTYRWLQNPDGEEENLSVVFMLTLSGNVARVETTFLAGKMSSDSFSEYGEGDKTKISDGSYNSNGTYSPFEKAIILGYIDGKVDGESGTVTVTPDIKYAIAKTYSNGTPIPSNSLTVGGSNNSVSFTIDSNTGVITVTNGSALKDEVIYVQATFRWGFHFGNKNPNEYYNSMSETNTISDGYQKGSSANVYNHGTNYGYSDHKFQGTSVAAYVDALASLEELNYLLGANAGYQFTFAAKAGN